MESSAPAASPPGTSSTLLVRTSSCKAKFSTIYNSFSVKGNTTIPLASLYSFVATDKLVRGIRNFSVAHPSEALQKSSPLEVKIGTKVNTNKLNANEEFLF